MSERTGIKEVTGGGRGGNERVKQNKTEQNKVHIHIASSPRPFACPLCSESCK
jgi:hypothetical protein